MNEILETSMPQPNDADAETIRDYLKSLLSALWDQEEMFSGKRPLGNSGWQYDLAQPVIDAGFAQDESEAWTLIYQAIQSL